MNKRKRQIIHAARQLFIEKGFNDTSIMDIISAANISKGTFYNHFTSKNQCLIAILEETREELISQRYEVALNEDPSDREILVKQIVLIAYINRKRNLVQIFESIAGNATDELKTFLEKYMYLEIDWLANRLVDVHGEKIRDISYECAVQAIGMIQQSLKVITLITKQLGQPEEVVRIVLDHIDAIIERQLKTKNVIINNKVIQAIKSKIEEQPVSKDELIKHMQGFIEKLTDNDPKNGYEYTSYLLNELKSENENIYILEAILQAFIKSFRATSHEGEVHGISIIFWRYIQMKKDLL